MPTGPKGEKRPADVIGNAVKVMRIHKTLRVTPAMAAGLCDTLMTWEQIVLAMDADAPKTGPRGPYTKKIAVNEI